LRETEDGVSKAGTGAISINAFVLQLNYRTCCILFALKAIPRSAAFPAGGG
jgi:hypothetical protein